MDGPGSRMGRASSRYGSTAVFSGPVRKWKKKWVQVSSSPSPRSVFSNHSSSQNQSNDSGSLLLCRWTPVSSGGVGMTETEEEPRRRKFRYTPIVVLGEQTKPSPRKIDEESKRSKVPHNIDDVSADELLDPKKRQFNLELDLEEQGGEDSD